MTREMKKILFANTRKMVIEEGSLSAPNNIALALTVNKNLQQYGVTLDASALRALSTQTADEMVRTWQEMDAIISDVTGAKDFQGELYYPNFPEEVMSASEAHLYLNSLFYYTFAQSNDAVLDAIAEEIRSAFTQEKEERLPLLEEHPRELKVVNKGTEDDLFSMMNARIHSLNMSENQLEELLAFSRVYHDKFDEMLGNDSKFQSKESKVKIAMILHNEHRDSELKFLLKDSVDVLRFAAMLSKENGMYQNNVELKALNPRQPIGFKLKNGEKRLIRDLLNNCDGLYVDIWKQEKLFKSLMGRLGTTANDNCPERVIGAFNNLARGQKLNEDGTPIFNPNKELPIAIEKANKGDFRALEGIAKARPGEFLRAYISTVEKINPEYREHVINMIGWCSNSTSVPMKNLLTVKGQLDIKEKELNSEEPMAKVYKHHGKYFVQEAKKTALTPENIEAMKASLVETASKMVEGYQNLGKVYIDPALAGVKAPGREMRSASGGAVLTPYSTIDMDVNKNLLTFGIRWEKIAGREDSHIDVDLSVHMYGADYSDKGHVSYSHLKTDGVVHSGDWTHVGSSGSSTEAILADKEILKENGVRYLIAEVHCFSIQSFKEAGNCRFVYEEKEGSMKTTDYDSQQRGWRERESGSGKAVFNGKVFEPSQLENCITLNSDNSTTVPLVYDVEEDRIYWLDNGITRTDMIRNTENPYIMSCAMSEIEIAHNNPYPDLQTLFTCYAQHNGEIVTDPKLADTVFTRGTIDREELGISEEARVVTSYDLDVISKEFSGNDDQSMLVVEEPTIPKETFMEKVEPALVKQLRYLNEKLDKFPLGQILEEEQQFDFGDLDQAE